MRPAGEIHQALLKAAQELFTPDKAPTLAELAGRACVGLEAARRTVFNMCRSDVLTVARTRKVPYRNKPVAEYAPAPPDVKDDSAAHVDVARAMSLWVNR